MLVIFDKKTRQQGVKEYLEQGTANDRDDKDKRVTLIGNLDITDKVVELGRKKGYKEAYRNIVLSFEEKLDTQTLENIARDFINLYMQPYQDDEYCVYAEAHLPKKKINSRGYERKNHIHIVIPKYSLKLQHQLDLGDHSRRLAEIEKIKEYLEAKYNLKSLNRKKIITQDKAEILDIEKYKNRNKAKKNIENYIAKNIEHYEKLDDLISDLEKKLDAEIKKSKNAKTPYISIKLKQFNRAIRLKGELFSDKTFKEAREQLLKNNKYVGIKTITRKDPQELLNELIELQKNRRERILKRIKNKRLQAEQKLIKKEQTQKVKNYITYAEKLLNKIYNYQFNLNLPKGFFVRKYKNTGYTLVKNKKRGVKIVDKGNRIVAQGKNLEEQAKIMVEMAIAKDWDLKKVRVRGSKKFKQITKELIEQRLQQPFSLDNAKASIKKETQPSSYTQSKLQTAKDQQQIKELDLKTLKEVLTAEKLLNALKDKELLAKDYKIENNRIIVGKRKLNVVDFCLKELNLSFRETSRLLNKIYNIDLKNYKETAMKLSYNTYTKMDYPTKNWKVKELKNKSELETLIKTYPYSPFVFKNGERKSDNTAELTAIVLDFDNDNKNYLIKMQKVAERLKKQGIKALLVETKSSGKEKKGIVAERFRVIIPITQEINISKNNKEEYRRAVENFARELNLYDYLDKGALTDIARMYRPSPSNAKSIVLNGNSVDFEKMMINAKHQLIQEQKEKEEQLKKEKEERLKKLQSIESNINAYVWNGDNTNLTGLTYADIDKILNIDFMDLINYFEKVEKEYKEGTYKMIKTDIAKYSILKDKEVLHDFINNKTYNKISYLKEKLNVKNLMSLARALQNITGENYIKVNQQLVDNAIKKATEQATTLQEFNQIVKDICNVEFCRVDLKSNVIKIADIEVNVDTKAILNKINQNKKEFEEKQAEEQAYKPTRGIGR